MAQKKKIKNKENFQPIKKTTIQQINYTEELRMPTLNTIDFKNFGKSIQLKKQKKPVSRKSRCVSVKQTCTSVKQTTTQPIKYKQLLKRFQQLKLLQDKSKSKQKQSKSSLSQSKRKNTSKKLNLTTLITKSNSRPSYCHSQFNLTHKLQKTLKKFNETDYFKDEDQLIPFASTSQPYIDEQKKNYQITNLNNEEEINILQMRKFSRYKEQQADSDSYKRNIQYFKGDQYEMMAIRIQRAWRQFRTKKLVQRYAAIFYQQRQPSSQQSIDFQNQEQGNFNNQLDGSVDFQNEEQQFLESSSKQGMIKTQQLYPDELQQHKITYISNLSSQQSVKQQEKQAFDSNQRHINQQEQTNENQEQIKRSYEQIINQIKKKELVKWNQVILLLSQNKTNSDPERMKLLLQKIVYQSQKNKRQLQFKASEFLQSQQSNKFSSQNQKNSQKKHQLYEIKQNKIKQQSGPSQLSDFKKEEEFDSRKYIEYLDSDMFQFERDRSSDNSPTLNNNQDKLNKKISKRKQQQLLATLKFQEMPIRLGSHAYSKSESLQYLIEQSKSSNRNCMRLSKSNSQKNIDKVIKSISPNLMNYSIFQKQMQVDTLNIDLIRRQFLQNADPLQELQRFHKQDQLRIKICQNLQQYNINQLQHQSQKIQYSRDYQSDFQPQRAVTQIDLFKNSKGSQNKEMTCISVEQIDRNISSSDQSEDDEEDQKISNVSFMIFNFLVFQLLKQMAMHDSILDLFKTYSLKQKNKNKKEDVAVQKKGFSTTHHQVKSFAQGLIDYLLKQQPQVFQNLQVSAGPSALQMLHYMHPSEQQQSIINQSQQDQSAVMVIPNRIFQTYWKIKQKSLLFQTKDLKLTPQMLLRRRQNFQYIKGFNKIFCRSIFDTFNECLDFQRNYGQAGKPFPWKKSATFFHNKTLNQINKSIQISQKKIMQISMTYCGIIIQPSDMGKMSIQEGQQYLQHVQEDRMSRMLAQDLVQGQQKWTFYDDQQTQILVQIGNSLALQLFLQAWSQIEELGFL